VSRDTYECPKCSWSEFPDFVLGEAGRLVAKCRNCLFTEKTLGPADFGRGIAAMPGDGGGTLPGWTGKAATAVEVTGASPVVDGRATPAVARQLDEIVRANDRRLAILQRIAKLHRALDGLEASTGIVPYLDGVVVRTLAAMESALEMSHKPAERDLAQRLVRDAGATLAAARRATRADTTAESLADEMIEKGARAQGAIPFAAKLPAARAELIAAVEASSVRGQPKKDARGRREKRDGAAKTALDALLARLDLPTVTTDGAKWTRRKLKGG
jgi:hypothetical protein